jgi:hypothetical protein
MNDVRRKVLTEAACVGVKGIVDQLVAAGMSADDAVMTVLGSAIGVGGRVIGLGPMALVARSVLAPIADDELARAGQRPN